ncbi:hypothetical protein CPT_Mater134 [Bacillus phage Mater]|uniref:Uncharacterized protein n=1 Tax=Bacillus phage Mater TaxID=1540090 RepID=A0A0A0RS24_9CAUD|nr:hypothetical protein CPT_Mater134 [Bacillus phage Mater]AIW03291.1 hypothetical protein CPT_Mater134 [Bacillus phage Mater]
MKPVFAVCSTEEVMYKGSIIENSPVNLSLCYSIKKAQNAWYPDNEGIPAIVFKVAGEENPHKWVYQTKAMRDKDYNKLLEGAINGEIN